MTYDGLDLDALTNQPTRLRAMAAAVALLVAGEKPSLTRVAELAGVSRQALHKSHEPVVRYVQEIRRTWHPPTSGPQAQMIADLEEARAALAKERRLRKEAERQRDRALHHLELSDATVRALSQPGTNAVPFRSGR